MSKIIFLVILLQFVSLFGLAQIHLSHVNTGDCVAARIIAKRTAYLDSLDRKFCAEHNREYSKLKKCLENVSAEDVFSFFTDRCSESEYFIGINGKELKLSQTSKKVSIPYFIGTFKGDGITVNISNPRLVKKTYFPGEAKIEMNVEDATYKVDVTVTKGKLTSNFKDMQLWYGR